MFIDPPADCEARSYKTVNCVQNHVKNKPSVSFCNPLWRLIKVRCFFTAHSHLWRSCHWSCGEVTLWGHLFPDERRTCPSSSQPPIDTQTPTEGQQDNSSNTAASRAERHTDYCHAHYLFSKSIFAFCYNIDIESTTVDNSSRERKNICFRLHSRLQDNSIFGDINGTETVLMRHCDPLKLYFEKSE